MYNFGCDKRQAFQRYIEQAANLHAGTTLGSQESNGNTYLKDVCNLYLEHQHSRVQAGEITVCSIALAIASGHERTSMSLLPFFCEIAERQRMPLSCSMSTSGLTPQRRATETALQVASDCAGQPPAFPKLAKTSQRPRSSLLTVTKSVPQPMRNLVVEPSVVRTLGLTAGPDAAG